MRDLRSAFDPKRTRQRMLVGCANLKADPRAPGSYMGAAPCLGNGGPPVPLHLLLTLNPIADLKSTNRFGKNVSWHGRFSAGALTALVRRARSRSGTVRSVVAWDASVSLRHTLANTAGRLTINCCDSPPLRTHAGYLQWSPASATMMTANPHEKRLLAAIRMRCPELNIGTFGVAVIVST